MTVLTTRCRDLKTAIGALTAVCAAQWVGAQQAATPPAAPAAIQEVVVTGSRIHVILRIQRQIRRSPLSARTCWRTAAMFRSATP